MKPSSSSGAESASSHAIELSERVTSFAEGSIRCVLLYGSHLLKTNPDRHSAIDFVLVVDEYRPFYQALRSAGQLSRPVGLMSALANVLPPNVIALAPDGPDGGLAKCLVVSAAHLESALGAQPKDHFLLGRLVQRIGYLWARTEADDTWVRGVVSGAHARVLQWMAPYLTEPVDAAGLGRRMLEVCYQGEVRPEAKNRSDRVFEAQSDHMITALRPVLEAAVSTGRMQRDGDRFVLTRPVKTSDRARWRRHFLRSKVRSTSRWLKHMLTFDNWLPYVTRKVERHTGRKIHLTLLERRFPLLFLWPRAIHVLTTRPRSEVPR